MKTNIKNSFILGELAKLGNGDVIVIGSVDFPIPDTATLIDVSVKEGMPTIEDIVEPLLLDCGFASMTMCDELEKDFEESKNTIIKLTEFDSVESLTFRQLKVVAKNAKFVIRTGDSNEYKSIVLTM